MKKMWTVFALAMIMLASCVSEDLGNAEGQSRGEEVTVKIGFDGEILDITEGPLETKASGDDLYGIQVYFSPSNGANEICFAYGVFDDPSKMEIKLLTGYKYRFEATMIKDGVNVVRHYYDSDSGQQWFEAPFNNTLENEFKYSSKQGTCPYDSWVLMQEPQKESYARPSVMRYYGEINYTLSTPESSPININMYQVVFGAKFNMVNLTEGKVNIEISEAPAMSITHPKTSVEGIFTFGSFWTHESPEGEYTNEGVIRSEETITTNITWTKNDGITIPVYNGPIKFTRNKQTIVTVNLDQESESLGTKVEIDLEDTPMTPGDEATINPGDQVPSYN